MKIRDFKMEEADGGIPPVGGSILGGTPPETPPVVEVIDPIVLPEFLAGIDEDIRSEASLSDFKDINALAKSYVHANKQMGKDKVVLPSKHATPEDWREFMGKVGLPETQEDYELEMFEDSNLSEEYVEEFTKRAFEQGILPHQAQAMLDRLDEEAGESVISGETADEEQIASNLAELEQEYGQGLNAKLRQVNNLLTEVADESTREYIEESGLASDPKFIKMLVTMSDRFTGEDTFDVNTNPLGAMSPMEAQKEIDAINDNPAHPYWVKQHTGHDNAVKEMEKLFGFIG